ncbi:MAG TPA: hypothetical protein VFR81_29360 [Longimicrobium sp.]|nr:hypothetical protein [Longimicrobium sp.]
MRSALAGCLAVASVVALGAPALEAQRAAPVSLVAQPARARADSARVLRGARQAQAAFERLRFRHLPWSSSGGGGGGRCDEHIGRFCIWHEDEETPPWKAPPEPGPVKTGRDRLLAGLAEAADASPGDAWVAGQRVRYLVEAGRPAEAVAAARACRSEPWWCRALEGYAHHAAGAHVDAEAAFAAAVEAMPAEERREWTDLSPLLEDGDARALRRLPAGARDSLERRLWWLADPFWSLPGNDRKTEHFARLVADRFQDRARVTEGLAWASDLREILLRYGQPTGWERIRTPYITQSAASVITHYAPESYEFLPRLRDVREPALLGPGEWKLEDHRARTSYAPHAAVSVDELPHQLAVFRRGGLAEVVAAFALEHDSLPAAPEVEAALVLARDERAEPVTVTARMPGRRAVLRAAAAPETVMASLEVRERATRRAGRARFGADLRLEPGERITLSDVLLLADPDARPATLDEAAPLARASTRLAPGERVALFWEVYGVEPGMDSVTVSVAVARKTVGGIRRAAERLGLARAATPVRMRWNEEIAAGDVLARSLAIAIPNLPAGDYVLEVAVRARGGASASTLREITVERERRKR